MSSPTPQRGRYRATALTPLAEEDHDRENQNNQIDDPYSQPGAPSAFGPSSSSMKSSVWKAKPYTRGSEERATTRNRRSQTITTLATQHSPSQAGGLPANYHQGHPFSLDASRGKSEVQFLREEPARRRIMGVGGGEGVCEICGGEYIMEGSTCKCWDPAPHSLSAFPPSNGADSKLHPFNPRSPHTPRAPLHNENEHFHSPTDSTRSLTPRLRDQTPTQAHRDQPPHGPQTEPSTPLRTLSEAGVSQPVRKGFRASAREAAKKLLQAQTQAQEQERVRPKVVLPQPTISIRPIEETTTISVPWGYGEEGGKVCVLVPKVIAAGVWMGGERIVEKCDGCGKNFEDYNEIAYHLTTTLFPDGRSPTRCRILKKLLKSRGVKAKARLSDIRIFFDPAKIIRNGVLVSWRPPAGTGMELFMPERRFFVERHRAAEPLAEVELDYSVPSKKKQRVRRKRTPVKERREREAREAAEAEENGEDVEDVASQDGTVEEEVAPVTFAEEEPVNAPSKRKRVRPGRLLARRGKEQEMAMEKMGEWAESIEPEDDPTENATGEDVAVEVVRAPEWKLAMVDGGVVVFAPRVRGVKLGRGEEGVGRCMNCSSKEMTTSDMLSHYSATNLSTSNGNRCPAILEIIRQRHDADQPALPPLNVFFDPEYDIVDGKVTARVTRTWDKLEVFVAGEQYVD